MSSLAAFFRDHVRARGLMPEAGRIIVAVSGGVDSVVLLRLVREMLPDATLAVAHFDHQWRSESAQDAHFVASLAATHDAAFLHGRNARPTSHTETDARRERYAFFETVAREWNADVIATAHHADDNAETVLFRIARGTGTRGLRGIPERRGRIVRPLLPFTRVQLREYAERADMMWREDASNTDTRHARNRIRHVLLPALEARDPAVRVRLLEIAGLAADAEAHWREVVAEAAAEVAERRADGAFTLAREPLCRYDPRVRARVMRTLCRRLGHALDRSGTLAVAEFIMHGRSGSHMRLAPDVIFTREFDRFVLSRDVPADGDRSLRITGGQRGAGVARVGGREVRVRWSVGDEAADGFAAEYEAALEEIRFPLVVRGWLPGDRIRTDAGSKKLKKLFVERRVGRSQRRRIPVLAQADGRVLWLPGVARAAGNAPMSGVPTFRIRIEE